MLACAAREWRAMRVGAERSALAGYGLEPICHNHLQVVVIEQVIITTPGTAETLL